MKKTRNHQKIPFVISIVLYMLWINTVGFIPDKGFINDSNLLGKYSIYLTGFGLLVSLVCLLLKFDWWKHILFTMFLLSSFNIISMSNGYIMIGAGVITIKLGALLLLFFHTILNPETWFKIKSIFDSSEDLELIEKNKKNNFEKEVQDFIKKFSDKETIALQRILNDESFTSEAKEAARRVINER